MTRIWIDADACPRPVKAIVLRASTRLGVEVCLVANHPIEPPRSRLVRAVLVSHGADVADDWIAAQVELDDIVITADVPLAARVVERGALCIDPRGEVFTAENVRERLSVRDFMHELRETGVQTGGPGAFGDREKQRFANALDRALTKRMRKPEPR